MASVDQYDFPDDRYYDRREHFWLRPERSGAEVVVTVGVDAVGQEALGEVVYVQLLESGSTVRRGDAIGSLEAEKMVRPVVAPLSGLLLERNEALLRAPRLLNNDPYGQGWLVRIRADRWDEEILEFLHGPEAVSAWINAELSSHG
jgi:glycine cleavage system H protein